jgi:hypothetical protein
MMLEEIPEWLAAAVLAAVFAAVGYVCKQVLEWLITLRSSHRTRKARLVALLSLLRGSGAVFRVQATLRNRLYTALISGHPSLEQAHEGYEALFSAAFKTFTPEQRELHALIRSYTINGIRPLNEAMVTWLQEDSEFKLGKPLKSRRRRLAEELAALEPHLRVWLAKYAASSAFPP